MRSPFARAGDLDMLASQRLHLVRQSMLSSLWPRAALVASSFAPRPCASSRASDWSASFPSLFRAQDYSQAPPVPAFGRGDHGEGKGSRKLIETVAIAIVRLSLAPASSGATSAGHGARFLFSQALYKWLFEAGFDYVSASQKAQWPPAVLGSAPVFRVTARFLAASLARAGGRSPGSPRRSAGWLLHRTVIGGLRSGQVTALAG